MRPKFVALIVAASLSTGWLLASMVSPPVAELQVLPPRDQPRETPRETTSATSYSEQLHRKLQAAPLPPVPKRNPFVFGTRERVMAPAPARTAPMSDAPVSEPLPAPVATGPSLRLAGIGTTGTARTAVISDGMTVHLVKVGETVGGYAVVEITESSATLVDAAGAQWLLRMK
jgi:hypothetical protein